MLNKLKSSLVNQSEAIEQLNKFHYSNNKRKVGRIVVFHCDVNVNNFTANTWLTNAFQFCTSDELSAYAPLEDQYYTIVVIAGTSVQGYGKLLLKPSGYADVLLNISGTITNISGNFVYYTNKE